jgi:hypothetical protein
LMFEDLEEAMCLEMQNISICIQFPNLKITVPNDQCANKCFGIREWKGVENDPPINIFRTEIRSLIYLKHF